MESIRHPPRQFNRRNDFETRGLSVHYQELGLLISLVIYVRHYKPIILVHCTILCHEERLAARTARLVHARTDHRHTLVVFVP